MANEFKVKNGLLVSGSANINASGSGVFTVDGTSGRLFQIDDSLSGSLFSVNTAAGLPIIEAFSDNTVRIGQYGQRALFISQSKVGIGKESALNGLLDVSGSVTVTGSVNVTGSITGSLLGTASFAVSASWAPGGGAASSNLIFSGSVTASVNVSSTNAFNVVSASNTLIQVTPNRTLLVGDATQIPNEAAWKSPGVFGSGSANKVLAGYLASVTNGATIGANNFNFTSWADLNIAGTNLIFRSGETEYMRMTSTGNFGIGVTSPGAKLHVAGAVSASNFTGSLLGTSSFSSNAALLNGTASAIFATTGSNTFRGNQIITGSLVTTGSIIATRGLGNFIELESTGSGNRPYIKLFDNGVADFRMYTSIGATYGNVTFNDGFSFFNNTLNNNASLIAGKIVAVSGAFVATNAGGDAQVNIASPSGFSNYVSFRENGVANRGVIGYANGTSYLQIRTNGATSMATGDLAVVVDNTGSVGIGITSPAYKLDVSGTSRLAGDTLINSTNGLTVTTTVSSTPAILNAGGSSTAALELQSLSARRFRILSTSATTTFEATNTSGFIMNSNLNVQGNITGSSFTGSFTGSLLGTSSFATSASQATTASYVLQAVSASFATSASRAVSASFATTAASATTASYVLNAVSASFAATASSADNFTVRNTLTAQTIVVQTITSSTDFVTGSSRFGSLITNTHQFTGSVGMTGSLTVIGPVSASAFTGSLLGTASFSTTASYALDIDGGFY
jgi:hypothetical protein